MHHGSICSLCILSQECILHHLYITTCHARDGVSETPEHSNDIYLPSSSLIGDTDTVAWLRATRCTGTRPHRASQAPIVCTVLHCMQRRPSKPQNRRPSWSSPAVERQSLLWRSAKTSVHFCARTAHAPTFGPKRRHAEGPCACRGALGFCRRPHHVGRNRYQK